jgi:hypothetical protein
LPVSCQLIFDDLGTVRANCEDTYLGWYQKWPANHFYSWLFALLNNIFVAVANSRLQSTMIMSDNDNNHHGGWNIEFHSLPSHTHEDEQHDDHKTTACTEEGIILTSISLSSLFANDANAYHAFTGTTNGRNEINNDNEEKDVDAMVGPQYITPYGGLQMCCGKQEYCLCGVFLISTQ